MMNKNEWKKVKLGDIGEIITGITPSTSNKNFYNSNDIPFYKPNDLLDKNIKVLNEASAYISNSAKSKAKIVKEKSLLVTCIGIIGKVAIINKEGAFNQQINCIIPKESICDLNYLAYAIKNKQKYMQQIANAAIVPIINKTQFSNIEILLPNIEIQKIISKKLNILQNILEKQSQQLFELEKLVKFQFLKIFGESKTNIKNWEIKKLEDICFVGSSKRVFINEIVEKGIPFYRGTEIGKLAVGEDILPTLFITKEHYEILCKISGVPAKGDLLLPSICPDGRIWLVDKDTPFYFKDGRVLWIHPKDNVIDSIYLLYSLKEKFISDYHNIASGTTFKELKIFILKNLKIMYPPIELQNKFAEFIKQVDKSKVELQKSIDETQLLFDSLMDRYFG